MAQVFSSIEQENYITKISNGSSIIVSDEPEHLGGKNAGLAPEELLLSSLAACTSITIKMYANRKSWPLEKVEIEINSQNSANGFVIERKIKIIGNLDGEKKERLLQIAHLCPVHKILTNSIQINTLLQ